VPPKSNLGAIGQELALGNGAGFDQFVEGGSANAQKPRRIARPKRLGPRIWALKKIHVVNLVAKIS
jgi:hypothetical protein